MNESQIRKSIYRLKHIILTAMAMLESGGERTKTGISHFLLIFRTAKHLKASTE